MARDAAIAEEVMKGTVRWPSARQDFWATALPVLNSEIRSQAYASLADHARHFRLVDRNGAPHPVLDDLYDSLDAAWEEAKRWWQGQGHLSDRAIDIGVEVSTRSGNWRTLRHPGSQPSISV